MSRSFFKFEVLRHYNVKRIVVAIDKTRELLFPFDASEKDQKILIDAIDKMIANLMEEKAKVENGDYS
jgi:hypothetical protein